MLTRRASVRVLLAIGLGMLAGSACQTETRCAVCHLPIPAETRALVRIDGGSPQAVCDLRCPITLREQTGRSIQATEVTDYDTRVTLDPSDAFYVTGSDTAPDAHADAVRTAPADASYLHWHRCLPSVLAFGTQEQATRFQHAHGGQVMTLADVGLDEAP